MQSTQNDKIVVHAMNEFWAMDFVSDQLFNGKHFRALTAYSRECLDIYADKALKGETVATVLDRRKETRRLPKHMKVDNGREFISKALDAWPISTM